MEAFVYILECQDNSFYTGYTTNLRRRILQHTKGVGSKYVRSRGFKRLLYCEMLLSKSMAMKREKQIKSFSRLRKSQLISSSQNFIDTINIGK